MAVSVGSEVLITDYPERYPWMAEIVGKKAVVEAVQDKPPAFKLRVACSEAELSFWLGLGYVEPVAEEGAA